MSWRPESSLGCWRETGTCTWNHLRHWFNSIGGIVTHPNCPTCLQAKPGTMYDYMCMHPRVAGRAGRALVHEDSDLFPHVP
eukprot:6358912-Pyramimonas_sp.AAC.1